MKIRWFKLFYFDLPFILFILLFLYLTIHSLPAPSAHPNADAIGTNIFLQYFNSHLPYIALTGILFCIFLTLFIFSGFHMSKGHTHTPGKKMFKPAFRYAFGLAAMALISFPLSFATIYVYAFAHINYQIIAYNYGGKDKNVLTAPQAIADAIADTESLTITQIAADTYKKDILLLSIKEKDGFYEEVILPAFPNLLFKRSYIPDTDIAFVNNHLAIKTLTPDQLAIISPALGKFLIEYSTEQSITKAQPAISILEKSEYMAVRQEHILEQIEQIDTVITTIDDSVASVSEYIAANEASIASNQELVQKALEQKQSARCKAPAQCTAIEAKWDRVMQQAQRNIANAQSALQKNQVVLGTSIQSINNLENAKTEMSAAIAFTEHELGLFSPGNKIIMTMPEADDPHMFDTYLATLIHEYFHYLTYIDEETKLDHFFEEALTEHFARLAYKNYTGKSLDLGYKIGVRIIAAMIKKVPERELLTIYYEKDQKALEELLNKTYGDSFYQDNAAAFNMINHLPFEDGVEIANLIMVQIGGEQLTIKDSGEHDAFTIPAPDTSENLPKNGSTSTFALPE